MKNRTILQNFEWYLSDDGQHWNRTAKEAARLAELGFTDVWLPPAYKGIEGGSDVGYGVYDHYDLGEFDQQGSVRTKYGTKDEYLNAIQALQANGIRAIGDIVLNHRMGGDDVQETTVNQMEDEHRLTIKVPGKRAIVRTIFTFPGRAGKYSTFTWNLDHFNGIDRNELNPDGGPALEGILKLLPRVFNTNVSKEKDNFDYLMGCNHDFTNPDVKNELINWGLWYMKFTGLDGVRLDALKHIDYNFFPEWLWRIREKKDGDVFAVGEYWDGSLEELRTYLRNSHHCMSLFDVALHYRLYHLSHDNRYIGGNEDPINMANLLHNTLMEAEPNNAVTFVDNHDTQEGQGLYSWINDWFKPLAYALILLRNKGVPCVFYGDLYGVPNHHHQPVPGLLTMLKARQRFAYGEQTDYFDHPNTVGWTRRGSWAGDMAVVMTNGTFGWKDMEVGKPGQVFVDLLYNRHEEVVIGPDGKGRFTVNERSVSIWVPKEAAYA